jgi:hypothetical protein
MDDVSHFADVDSLLIMQFVLNLSYKNTMKNAPLTVAVVALLALFVGKSVAA